MNLFDLVYLEFLRWVYAIPFLTAVMLAGGSGLLIMLFAWVYTYVVTPANDSTFTPR